MRGPVGIALLATALAVGTASAALAQTPEKRTGGPPASDGYIVLVEQRIVQPPMSSGLDDQIVIADLRLPTLGDLSKERWNQVHRRYDSGRGRREKLRT